MSDLDIEGLEITYGKLPVVSNFDLRVDSGEFVSLLGPSGSGKTSVLRAIGGYQSPSKGAIVIAGRDVTRIPPQGRDIGMVFQSLVLFPHLSVQKNVEFGLRTRKVVSHERRRRAMDILETMQIQHLSKRLPFQLSGGQQQRVALARALVIRPALLLMDEPLSALDTKLRVQMQLEIRALQQITGVTTIFVTHDQQEAMAMSDRVVVMRDGKIAEQGDPEELYRKPKDRFTAEFMGTTTVLHVEIETVLPSGARVRLPGSAFEFEACGIVGDSRTAIVSLRPEDVHCSKTYRSNALPGTVVSRTFRGLTTVVSVQTTDHTLLALQGRGDNLHEGDEVFLTWAPASARLFPAESA